MPNGSQTTRLHPHIRAVMEETGFDNPFEAVRAKAQVVVEQFHQLFRETPPFNLEALASVRGLRLSKDAPHHSRDSEIAPEADGRVVLRVNRDRPRTRQRFSIGHEVGHTLFPEYQLKVRCRKPVDHDWADSNDLLETLCDIAASEILFPLPWFADRIGSLALSAAALAELAGEYQASREATIRRFVETTSVNCAVVFLSWKLKPKQEKQLMGDRQQSFMFGIDPVAQAESNRKLRVDYAIPSKAFRQRRSNHIPPNKSIEAEGPAYEAALRQRCSDGEGYFDLGPVHGTFTIHAVPVYTRDDELGPNGECSVAIVLR